MALKGSNMDDEATVGGDKWMLECEEFYNKFDVRKVSLDWTSFNKVVDTELNGDEYEVQNE